MKIAHVGIHNYCSIADLELSLEDFTVLLGPNNSGKSNIIRAVDFALSGSVKVDKGCFFEFRATGDDELWVELTFADLTAQEQKTFEKYVHPNGTVRIRKTAALFGDVVETGYRGYVQQPAEWWLRSEAFGELDTLAKVSAAVSEQGIAALQPLVDEGGRITRQRLQDFQQDYLRSGNGSGAFTEELESGPLFGTRNVAAGLLPEFFLIPAVRDAEEETRSKGSSTFARLSQRAIREMSLASVGLNDLRTRIRGVVDEFNARTASNGHPPSPLAQLEAEIDAELRDWGTTTSIRVDDIDVDRVFELSTRLLIDDGVATSVERKGHGLQRAILLAIIRAWARYLQAVPQPEETVPRRASESVIFAVEEPELYLHPHAQRQLARALRDVAAQAQHQVLVCSHSAYFVSMEHYRTIGVVSKSSSQEGTRVRQCTEDLFAGEDEDDKRRRFNMASWINPDRGEIFFAKRVVLVEGETERVCLPFLANLLGCSEPDASIIECGSKSAMPLYVTILNAFSLRYVVVHDEDPRHDGAIHGIARPSDMPPGQNRRIAEAIDPRLGEHIVFRDKFETVAGIPMRSKSKPMQALDHFAPKTEADLPLELTTVIRQVFGNADALIAAAELVTAAGRG